MSDLKEFCGFLAVMLIAVTLALGVAFAICVPFQYMGAKSQAAVYERQGIHITPWELFWGAKPAISTVRLGTEKE